MSGLLSDRLIANGDAWYALVNSPGREVDIKNHIIANNDTLNIVDMVIPEPSEGRRKEEQNRYRYFLGYVFIKTSLNIQKYNKILNIDGVYKFLENLCFDKGKVYIPVCIPEDQMLRLKEYLNGIIIVTKNKNEFDIGDDVEIMSGDLKGINGKIMSLTNNYAGLIAKNGFNQIIRVPVDRISRLILNDE